MVHCGYDPSGALGTNYKSGDNWKNFKYNFGAKPKPFPASPELAQRAFNGFTIGKGHLAEAKAAINSPAAGAQGAFSRKETTPAHETHVGTHCGTNESAENTAPMAQGDDAKKTA